MFTVLYFNIIIIIIRNRGRFDAGGSFFERASLALACPHVGVYIDPL